jgi:hypothetical protein
MADEFTERYRDLLTGWYDCVDRIVLNAYDGTGDLLKRTRELKTRAESLYLIAGMPHGAVDVRMHARVVERPGQDRHRDRAG